MIRYETLILTTPEITTDEATALEQNFERVVKKGQGVLNAFDRWGKYRLAYPVRAQDYGVYFLVRFEVGAEQITELTNDIYALITVKFPHFAIRYMTTKLEPGQSLLYHKPESLEDIPSQDVDTFLRENKMEGLIKGGGEKSRPKGSNDGDYEEAQGSDSLIDKE